MTEGSDEAPARRDPDAPSAEEAPTAEVPREFVQAEIAYRYQGPLPDPATLQGYEGVLPGSAERIVGRMEQETNHRHATERRGQYAGAGIAAAGLVGGFVLILLGHDWAGVVFTASGIAPIVYAFLRSGQRGGQREQANERTT